MSTLSVDLSGQVALVTGAGRGIGKAIARALAQSGAAVAINDIDAPRAEQTARELGGPARAFPADVSDPAAVEQMIAAVVREMGGLHILVNNAGLVPSGLLKDLSDADLEQAAATNIVAPIALTRDLLPLLRRSDRAWIVNIGSMFGDIGHPHFAAYCATKFGLRGFSDAIRRELARDRIGVTYAAPRATRTAATDGMATLVSGYHMKLDDPLAVARRIVAAVAAESTTVFPGATERLLIFIQRFFPALIDFGLRRQAAAILDR